MRTRFRKPLLYPVSGGAHCRDSERQALFEAGWGIQSRVCAVSLAGTPRPHLRGKRSSRMSFRNTALSAVLVVLAAAVIAGAAGAARGESAPRAPTNLRITATTATSISLAWNAPTGRIWKLLVLRAAGLHGLFPSQPAADDLHTLRTDAEHDVQLFRQDRRLPRPPFGEQQHRDLHDSARHDAAGPGAVTDGDLHQANENRSLLDGLPRQHKPGLVLALRQRKRLLPRLHRGPILDVLLPHAVDDVRVQGHRARQVLQHRREQCPLRDDAGGHRHRATDGADEPQRARRWTTRST